VLFRSEYELNKGYCDILLLPNLLQYPDIKYSYLIELKYIKPSDYAVALQEKKIKDAMEKLKRYENDEGLKKLMGKTEIRKIILLFSGIELKYKELVV